MLTDKRQMEISWNAEEGREPWWNKPAAITCQDSLHPQGSFSGHVSVSQKVTSPDKQTENNE